MGKPQSRKKNRAKKKKFHKIKKTKRYARDNDLIFEDLKPEKAQKLLNQPLNEELPGMG